MSPTEMLKLCAAAMGVQVHEYRHGNGVFHYGGSDASGVEDYDPFFNDAQAMALVKKLRLDIKAQPRLVWRVEGEAGAVRNTDLNRAIVECVAKIQKEKKA